mmetsp:Transcript_45764/g.85872  ORF Transcript_45764/g.85872 Transcript_45764/m.85872 type:complete len:98 (+) Transcript_45764:3-296(+)
MRGQVINLANKMPEGLAARIKDGINCAVMVAFFELQEEPDKGAAQTLLTVAGPPKEEGLSSCDPLANGWIFSEILDEENKKRMRDLHEQQAGTSKAA